MITITITPLLLWLFAPMPGTLPELFWILLCAVLGLLITAGVIIYRRDWTIIDIRFKCMQDALTEIHNDLASIREWQKDHEP